jgi:hypothetical protein
MDAITLFLDQVRDKMAQEPWFNDKGFTPGTVYRQFLSNVKDPVYPCSTLCVAPEAREVFANIHDLTLYVGFHSKRHRDVEESINAASDLLHNKPEVVGELTIYKINVVGGSKIPQFDRNLGIWEAFLELDCSVG